MDPVFLFAVISTVLTIFMAVYLAASTVIVLWLWRYAPYWITVLVAPVLLFGFFYSSMWAVTMMVNA